MDFIYIILTPCLLFAFTFFVLTPALFDRSNEWNNFISSLGFLRVFFHNKKNKGNMEKYDEKNLGKLLINIVMFFTILMLVVIIIGTQFNDLFLGMVMSLNFLSACIGAYVIKRELIFIPIVLAVIMILILAPEGILFLISFNVMTCLAICGCYLILRNTFSIQFLSMGMIVFCVIDIIMVSSGLLTTIFPFMISIDSKDFLFNFYYLPGGMKIGAGDFLGMMFVASLAIAQEVNYKLVFVIFIISMITIFGVIHLGITSLMPATLPLIPALLTIYLLNKKKTRIIDSA